MAQPSKKGKKVTVAQVIREGERALNGGKPEKALNCADQILRVEPASLVGLKLRALALSRLDRGAEALTVQQQVCLLEPDEPKELGKLIQMAAAEPKEARTAVVAAERLRAMDPDDYERNKLLGALYGAIGWRRRAEELALAAAAGREPFETRRSKGEERLRVLKLFSIANGTLRYNPASRGSVLQGTNNISALLDREHVTIYEMPIESLDHKPDILEALPEVDVIYNAIADGDRSGEALSRSLPYIDTLGVPVVNHPSSVLKSTRMGTHMRLRSLDGVIAPRTVNLTAQVGDCSRAIRKKVEANELSFPILVRPRQMHGQQHLVCFTAPEEVHYELPAGEQQDLNITEYVDCSFHSPKAPHLKLYAKYRFFIIDGELYPAHCEISDQYKVTLENSLPIMNQYPAFIEQAKRFLENPQAVLGDEVIERVRAVLEATELDYAAVDFCPLESGEIVVFEANAAMRNRLAGRRLPWEGEAYVRILRAFHDLLIERAGVSGWDYRLPQPTDAEREGTVDQTQLVYDHERPKEPTPA
ncbi:hypothetical protein LRF89_06060 [Halorhodospira sp. 9621]|uniref:hypothetical protein n=1 Tax=Halorhodospira sp. 9621 TaxID=2899135 RepID=UPI001EE7BDC9|nr:hypothetical protein [Halorhodospira sp. 9621]MCG5533006.1 hypothetical protein [Halorhodospira sp. 9621]